MIPPGRLRVASHDRELTPWCEEGARQMHLQRRRGCDDAYIDVSGAARCQYRHWLDQTVRRSDEYKRGVGEQENPEESGGWDAVHKVVTKCVDRGWLSLVADKPTKQTLEVMASAMRQESMEKCHRWINR